MVSGQPIVSKGFHFNTIRESDVFDITQESTVQNTNTVYFNLCLNKAIGVLFLVDLSIN